MKIDGLTIDAAPQAPTNPQPVAPKDQFLRLLIAQMQHQDPLQPKDGSEFIAQLAQLTAVEQTAETNQRLAALEAAQGATTRSGYTAMVGREVTATVDHIPVPMSEGGSSPTLVARLDTPASEVDVVISDASGREVRRISLGTQSAGDVTVPWDERGSDGQPLLPGDYKVEVRAKSSSGGSFSGVAAIRGVVRALEFNADGVLFRVGALHINPGEILSVANQPAASPVALPMRGGKESNYVSLDITHNGL